LVAKHKSGYYPDSEPVAKQNEGAKTLLNDVTGFSAAAASSNVITLTWTDSPEVESYAVYRFTGTSAGYANGGYIFDDWADITAKIYPLKSGATWIANDTDLTDTGKGYIYMIIAKKGTATSTPVLSNPVVRTNEIQKPTLTVALANPGNGNWNTFENKYEGIRITWTPKVGQEYALYRREVILNDNKDKVIAPASGTWDDNTWTPVTDKPVVPVDGVAGITDNPDKMKSYRYKLVVTQGTLKADVFAASDFIQYPYISGQANVTLTVTRAPKIGDDPTGLTVTGYIRGTAYQLAVQISNASILQLKSLLGADDEVRIFRAKTDASGNELEAYKPVTTSIGITGTGIKVSALTPGELAAETLDPGYYRYRARVYVGGKEQKNGADDPGVQFTSGFQAIDTITVTKGTGTTANTIRFEYTSTTKQEYVKGTTLVLKYANGSTLLEAQNKVDNDAYTTQNFVLDRTASQTVTADNNRYFTGNFSAAPSTTNYIYGELYRINGNGTNTQVWSGQVN